MKANGNSAARILDAALSLFSEKGYEATSTREICELAGITKPTLYYFHKSKEGVYRALITQADNEFRRTVEVGLSSKGSLRDRYKKIGERVFVETLQHERLARFMFSIVWAPNASLVTEVHRFYATNVARIVEATKEAVRAGEIRDGNAEVRVLVLMGGLMEALSDYLVMGHPKLTRELAHEIVDTIFDGWQPPQTEVQTQK